MTSATILPIAQATVNARLHGLHRRRSRQRPSPLIVLSINDEVGVRKTRVAWAILEDELHIVAAAEGTLRRRNCPIGVRWSDTSTEITKAHE